MAKLGRFPLKVGVFRTGRWLAGPLDRGLVKSRSGVGRPSDPHRRGEVWTCRVLPLVVFVRMPVADSGPLLPT